MRPGASEAGSARSNQVAQRGTGWFAFALGTQHAVPAQELSEQRSVIRTEVHVKPYGGETMLATFAFDVCHDVYRAAREVIDTKIPTLNMESSGKYTWHPDRMPRLAEEVAGFSPAGGRGAAGG